MRSTWWPGLFLVAVLLVSAAAGASAFPFTPAGHPDSWLTVSDAPQAANTTQAAAADARASADADPVDAKEPDAPAWAAVGHVRERTGTTTPELAAALPNAAREESQREHDESRPHPSREREEGRQPSGDEAPEEGSGSSRHEQEPSLLGQVVSLVPTTSRPTPLAPLLPDADELFVDPTGFAPPTNEAPAQPRTDPAPSQPLNAAAAAPVEEPVVPAVVLALAGAAAVTAGAAAAGTGGPSSLLAWLRRVFWLPLYARVAKDKVLDHETRQELLDRLRASPGSCVAELQSASGVSLNTIRHHLRVMQANGVVTSVKQGRRRCFFPVETGWSQENRIAAAALSARAPRKVFRVIKSRPGIAQQELAAALGVTPTSIAFHARRLQEAGVVRAERTGRVMTYFPATSAV